MPRFILTTLLGLTVAIGSLLGVLAWRTLSYHPEVTDLSAADPKIGYAFYDAIDQVLDGKDPETLQQLLATGFVDHGADGNGDRSATELLAELTTLRQSFPDAELKVRTVEAASGTLIALVEPVGLDSATVAGVPFSIPSIEPEYEVLRVRNGMVAERWAGTAAPIGLHTFPEAAFSVGGTFAASTRLERIDLQKHASSKFRAGGVVILMGESGITRVNMNWSNSSGLPESAVVDLAAGETLRIPGGAAVRLEPYGDEPARLLEYAVQRASPIDAPPPALTGNITIQSLWASSLPAMTAGTWDVSVGQLLLPLDTEGELTPGANDTLLLCIDSGALELVTQGGTLSSLGTDRWPEKRGGAAEIGVDLAANIEGATTVGLHSDADVPAWLIVVTANQPSSALPANGTPVAN